MLDPEDPDSDRNRATYLESVRRRRASSLPESLKFGDPGGVGRRITPVSNRD